MPGSSSTSQFPSPGKNRGISHLHSTSILLETVINHFWWIYHFRGLEYTARRKTSADGSSTLLPDLLFTLIFSHDLLILAPIGVSFGYRQPQILEFLVGFFYFSTVFAFAIFCSHHLTMINRVSISVCILNRLHLFHTLLLRQLILQCFIELVFCDVS